MKNRINKTISNISLSIFAMLLAVTTISAAPVIRDAGGANPAAIQAAVDLFRADLGGNNNGVGSSFTTGRREINWDGVPDAFAEPNNYPNDFFNVNSPRGVVFQSILSGNTQATQFRVSATQESGTAVRFGNIDASYSTAFQTFSTQRLFQLKGNNMMEILFFVPGTKIPATVSGFGAVFCDIDLAGATVIDYFDGSGKLLARIAPINANNGLSFVGISFNAGERIAKVVIKLGNANLASGTVDGVNGVDVVAMDDFIYGEPRAAEYHTSDFDGDGTTDTAVFRPSTGQWFVLNSGSNTFNGVQFGQNGDVPVDGDFDGDRRSDTIVFRPSTGQWFSLASSTGAFSAVQFGLNGDKPTPGDFDKDGKTDIAVFRPSSGNWFHLRSSNGQFVATQFGQNGDIPISVSGQ